MLADLVQGAREDALSRESERSIDQLEVLASQAPAVKAGADLRGVARGVGIIAEIKRRSPSKGSLAEIADPVSLAKNYEAGGATAISVLTEQRRFGGSLEDLSAVAQATTIPVLRKDFISTDYQVVEARAYGADIILLIVAALSDEELSHLLQLSARWGMTALVEAHSADEVRRAVAIGAKIIGVNARDLSTFEVDKTLFGRLRHLIPEDVVAVAESAVSGIDDVRAYRDQGADVVLVGEALVTGENPQQSVREYRLL